MTTEAKLIKYFGIKHIAEHGTLWPSGFNMKERQWLQDNYKPEDNEIFIVTYAKNGTTLTQQICHEIMKCYYLKTKSSNHEYYASTNGHFNHDEWIELIRSISKENFEKYIQKTKNTKRFWKTHAMLEHFPSQSLPKKMIIVCRNPKDACVSFYHHTKNNTKFTFDSDFDTFYQLFIAGILGNDCYFKFYKEYWKLYMSKARETEILWLHYENLVKDKRSKKAEIKRLIEFIGVDDVKYSDDDIESILNGTSLSEMKKQYNEWNVISNFVRKGRIGDWKNYFNDEQNEIMDTMIRMHFHGTSFKYYQDLEDGKDYMTSNALGRNVKSKL